MRTLNRGFMPKSLVGLLLVCILVPCLPSFGQEPTSVDHYAVFDANNKRIGRAVGTTGDVPKVAMKVNSQFFILSVEKQLFGGREFIYFESDDCTGPPLMELPPATPQEGSQSPFPTIVGVCGENGEPGNVVYTPNLSEVASSITTHSVAFTSSGCSEWEATNNLVSALKVVDMDNFFIPPFTVKPENQVASDVNGDGFADFVWRNTENGETAVWLMNASGLLDNATFPGGAGSDWVIRGVKDVNGDGFADLVWRSTSSGATAVWLMNSEGLRESITMPAGAGADWQLRP